MNVQMEHIIDMLNTHMTTLEHKSLKIFIEKHVIKVRKRRECEALVAIFRWSDANALRVFAEQLMLVEY